jgi:ATP synthase protein I
VLNSPAFGLLGVGFSLAIWIVGGTLFGRWLDGKFDTDPVLTLLMLLAGLAIGLTDAVRRLRAVMVRIERKRRG